MKRLIETIGVQRLIDKVLAQVMDVLGRIRETVFRTIVVKFCNCGMGLLGHVRSDMTDRAYWFLWKVRFYAMGYSDSDTVDKPCWYCVVGAENPNDPEEVSCWYCLSGEVNPETERYRQNEGRLCWYCKVGAKHPDDAVPVKGCEKVLLEEVACVT